VTPNAGAAVKAARPTTNATTAASTFRGSVMYGR
jgi:hypothetical protein